MRVAVALLATMAALAGCAGSGSSGTTATEPPTSSIAPPAPSTTVATVAPDPPGPETGSTTLVAFTDPASVNGWTNVDDTVMGGESESTTTWDAGRLVFAGLVSLANNGGFVSTIGPVDRSLGIRARGSNALVLDARGGARSYLMWLRAGPNGVDRWVANFEPPADGTCCGVAVPFSAFRSVGRFLQATTPDTPLDPATIVQIGFYLTDKQQGEFLLTLGSISAVR